MLGGDAHRVGDRVGVGTQDLPSCGENSVYGAIAGAIALNRRVTTLATS